jgi:hypothetical protein
MVGARIGILAVLALIPALLGCAQDVPPPPSPLSHAPAACQQAARNLGFIVLGTGELEPQPDGSAAYPVLVQWGNAGAVHLRCRPDGAGGATIG